MRQDSSDNKCPNCNLTKVIPNYATGEYVCTECGAVVEPIYHHSMDPTQSYPSSGCNENLIRESVDKIGKDATPSEITRKTGISDAMCPNLPNIVDEWRNHPTALRRGVRKIRHPPLENSDTVDLREIASLPDVTRIKQYTVDHFLAHFQISLSPQTKMVLHALVETECLWKISRRQLVVRVTWVCFYFVQRECRTRISTNALLKYIGVDSLRVTRTDRTKARDLIMSIYPGGSCSPAHYKIRLFRDYVKTKPWLESSVKQEIERILTIYPLYGDPPVIVAAVIYVIGNDDIKYCSMNDLSKYFQCTPRSLDTWVKRIRALVSKINNEA